jgi:hypothetical protein
VRQQYFIIGNLQTRETYTETYVADPNPDPEWAKIFSEKGKNEECFMFEEPESPL